MKFTDPRPMVAGFFLASAGRGLIGYLETRAIGIAMIQ